MVTGLELQSFAEEHGLLVPPYRDFEEWAQLINDRGGVCPCNKERRCPCPESIDEIANAPTDDVACCTCRFYCSQRYIDHWKKSWIKQKLIKPDEEITLQTKVQQPVREHRIIKNPEVQMVVNVFEKIKTYWEKENPAKAVEVLEKEAEESECSLCRDIMDTEAERARFLAKEFKIDLAAFKIDVARGIQRMEELIILYEMVDESLDTDLVKPTTSKTYTEEGQDDFHRCLSEALKHPTLKASVQISRDRLKVANIFCSGRAETLTDAIEFFKRQQEEAEGS